MNGSKWPPSRGQNPPWVEKVFAALERYGSHAYLGLAGLALVFWLATGFYIVDPGEQGVVRTFGRHSATTDPGLNYRVPWPVQTVDVVNVSGIRRAEIGFRTAAGGRSQGVLQEALMLTKDENIVEVQMLVQYRVKDPAVFLFNAQNPELVLAGAAEVALRSTVGRMLIDDVITERRAEVQEETKLFLERLLDTYKTGILVTDVRLQVADAPQQVRDAFHEVVRAREDRERLVNEAQAYMEDILPRARGVAQQIQEESIAYREERIRRARGDAVRFTQVLKEYQRAPEVTRERMHIEAIEEVLSRSAKVLMSHGVGDGVLPFLPLRGAAALSAPSSQGAGGPRKTEGEPQRPQDRDKTSDKPAPAAVERSAR